MLTDPFGTNAITHRIIGCAIRVHDVVGPGVFENVYSECLEYELREKGLSYETNRAVPIIYKGVRLRSKYYIDMVVEGVVVVELKVVAALAEIHKRQVLTQLKLTDLPVGLLLNFNVVTLKEGGIKRVVNPKYAEQFPVTQHRAKRGSATAGPANLTVGLMRSITDGSSFVFVASFRDPLSSYTFVRATQLRYPYL